MFYFAVTTLREVDTQFVPPPLKNVGLFATSFCLISISWHQDEITEGVRPTLLSFATLDFYKYTFGWAEVLSRVLSIKL